MRLYIKNNRILQFVRLKIRREHLSRKQAWPLINNYLADIQGVFAIKFAIGSVLLLTGISAAISTNQLVSTKADLQKAADAAVLAAATEADISLADRKINGEANFKQNVRDLSGVSHNNTLNVVGELPTNASPNSTITANIDVTAEVSNIFAFAIPGLSKLAVSSEAVVGFAPRTTPPFIDLYIVVDNSASMGIGQTKSDRDAMVYDTEISGELSMEPCAFACHTPSENSYDYYKNKGVRLRIDALSEALTGFVNKAVDEMDGATKNTRINIVPLDKMKVASSYKFSPSLTAAKTEAKNIKLTSGNGLTDLQTPLHKINKLIKNVGNGADAENPLVYVVLMTDGLEHFEDPSTSGSNLPALSATSEPDPTMGGTVIQTIKQKQCKTLRNRGVNVIVMNVEYGFPDLIWDWPVKNWQDIGYKPDLDQLKLVNKLLPDIPSKLRKCASDPGNYFQVEEESEMNIAFDTIFKEIAEKSNENIITRLTQ